MRTLIELLTSLASLANVVIYGTDVFGAIVLRPAIAAVDDRTLPGDWRCWLDRCHGDCRAFRRERTLGQRCSRSARNACPRHLPGDLQPVSKRVHRAQSSDLPRGRNT